MKGEGTYFKCSKFPGFLPKLCALCTQDVFRDAAKKVPPLMAMPFRGGGDVKAGPLVEELFLLHP